MHFFLAGVHFSTRGGSPTAERTEDAVFPVIHRVLADHRLRGGRCVQNDMLVRKVSLGYF